MGMAVGMPEVKGLSAAVDLAKNPLAETHEFRQACSVCYMKTGEELFLESLFVFVFMPLCCQEHFEEMSLFFILCHKISP